MKYFIFHINYEILRAQNSNINVSQNITPFKQKVTDVLVKLCLHLQGWLRLIASETFKSAVSFFQSKFLGYRTEMYCVSCEVRTEFICYVEEIRAPLWSSGQISWLHNGDVLCFLWGTNWIYKYYVEESKPPLWSNGQSSYLLYRDVLCFLWGTNWIYIYCVGGSRPPLWSSG
jgi:hypothetical protein